MQMKRSTKLITVLGAVLICALAFCGCAIFSEPNEESVNQHEIVTFEEVGNEGTVPLEEGRVVMTLCGSQDTYVRLGEAYVEGGCLVRDMEDGNLTNSVQTSGSVDTSTPGDYTVTYSVVNSDGMLSMCERRVHVVDDIAWNTAGVPVMMYHYVYDPENPPEDLDTNHVSTYELEEQLQWITSEGYYYPSWAELRAYVDGTHSLPEKSIAITFDDGEQGFLDYGIPLLNKYQVNATSFIVCERGDLQDVLNEYATPYVMFESHSYDLHHAGYTPKGRGGAIYDLDEDGLTADLQQAADLLGTKGAFAYPYGDVSDVSSAAVDRVGILCAFTIQWGYVQPGDDHTQLPRVRVQGGDSLDSYIWSVTGA